MKFYESDYEEALIALLQEAGWIYTPGKKLNRPNSEVLLRDDLYTYFRRVYPTLTESEIEEQIQRLRHVDGQTHFDQLRAIYRLLRNGTSYMRSTGERLDISYLDYEDVGRNIYRVVNQFEVGYGRGQDVRIPDVLLFVNGIPLCILELKNPTDADATIADAYQQIHVRYRRDIPHLLRYCPLSCISDATVNNTRLGTTYTPYEHYYAWKKVHNEDSTAQSGVDQVRTMVSGVYEPHRFTEILRDYIYFPDAKSDREEELVCRYPQFFAARMLRDHILGAHRTDDRRGGTYFGATGCGKTYTMMFLARQLAQRCPELQNPTIVVLVDRTDLQEQAGNLFLRSQEYLEVGAVQVIDSRSDLQRALQSNTGGGLYICTVQKFCEEIGELNARSNIICFSDEAHRTQTHIGTKLQVKDKPERRGDKLGAHITKPFAEHLRTAFPHATFVGFTGTPIDETIQVFGQVVESYTMRQAVEDGITRDIKYIPRIAHVTLDESEVKKIDAYYAKCLEEGATEEDVERSKHDMSSMNIILGNDERLERLAEDIRTHYMTATDNKPDVVQKGMIVCSTRGIAYKLLSKFRQLVPDWFTERKCPEGMQLEPSDLNRLAPMPMIAMVATRSANDPKEMYDYLGDKERTKLLAQMFKAEYSNFRLVIVVDMWITGFDVPSLTYLYNDKPLRRQNLIQTISRVNRNYPGKEYGYVIDYLGIHSPLLEAMHQFGGSDFGPSQDDVEQALGVLREELEMIRHVFHGFDLSRFIYPDVDPLSRLSCLSEAAEYIQSYPGKLRLVDDAGIPQSVEAKSYFQAHVKRLRSAYDICQPSSVLEQTELSLSQCYMAVSSFLRKTSAGRHDTASMNRVVEDMVARALNSSAVTSILNMDVEEQLFSPEFVEHLQEIRLPATKLELLVKMLRRGIQDYSKVNKITAERYEKLLRETLEQYHQHKEDTNLAGGGEDINKSLGSLIDMTTRRALDLLHQLGQERESFRALNLSAEEKAVYDILLHVRDKAGFSFGEDKQEGKLVINESCQELAQAVKAEIDKQTTFTNWLYNDNLMTELKRDIYYDLTKAGFPLKAAQEATILILGQAKNYATHLAG